MIYGRVARGDGGGQWRCGGGETTTDAAERDGAKAWRLWLICGGRVVSIAH